MSKDQLPDISLPSAALAWAWATEHGAPEQASTEQLVSWLGRGELPPHTLVWKRGWGEWLPAMQVAELAAAFPRVTAGSRRVARSTGDDAAPPPAVPIAHYPRLRLLAKDVLSESPLPPDVAARPLATVASERGTLRDPDQRRQEVATSQVPAAAMLAAARAMQERGALPPRSSAQRWSQLQLGTFGEPPPSSPLQSMPAAAAPVLSALQPVSLTPESLAAPMRAQRPTGSGNWISLVALIGSSLALLVMCWPTAADRMARVALGLRGLSAAESATPEQPAAIEVQTLSLTSLAEKRPGAPCAPEQTWNGPVATTRHGSGRAPADARLQDGPPGGGVALRPCGERE